MVQPLKNPFDSITFGSSLSLRVDGAIGAMSLSPNGRDAVLAGRRGLFIIDLDEPFTTPRWLHHITSWEVADVQWSPHHFSKPSWCISTSNQKALLWDLSRPSDSAILNVAHQHTRAITDINFHPSDPEIFATCSIDTFVLSWDMRTPRKAIHQWAEWKAGATQVKWNHKNPYEIASSHDHSFYIWDTRKGSLPVLRIEDAHEGKINGIDFTDGISSIITCSNDQKIKYWDLSTPDAVKVRQDFNYFAESEDDYNEITPAVVISADFPVARARTLPFGADKSCGVMPLRGGQDSVHVLNVDAALQEYMTTGKTQEMAFEPVHSFKGHGGPIKDFLWRRRHEWYEGIDAKEPWKDYQLVTWSSSDYDLKLWPSNDDLYKKVDYDPLQQTAFDYLPKTGINGKTTPALDDDKFGSPTPSSSALASVASESIQPYKYTTYCVEPPITLANILYKNRGDLLSAMSMFQIAKKHKGLPTLPSQLNHLAWISGVRMGRNDDDIGVDGSNPSNLGEEVSFMAHTFPKVRFEKISVSTGELRLSLRGPMPNIESTTNTEDDNEKSTAPDTETNNNPPQTSDSASEPQAAQKEEETKDTDESQTQQQSNQASAAGTQSQPTSSAQVTSPTQATTSAPTQGHTQTQTQTQTQSSQGQDIESKLIFIRLEISFPRNYPYLEDVPFNPSSTKKYQKAHFVRFDIEETHDLTAEIKAEMIKNLNEISHFYSNKHQRFCLEPLLRYLMGDRVSLDDALMMEQSSSKEEEQEMIREVGNEGWADDLINQQPDDHSDMASISSSEGLEDDQFSDFMPALNDEEMNHSTGSLGKDGHQDPSALAFSSDLVKTTEDESNNIDMGGKVFDSTPIPKGCGALWGPNGQLVCFFIPKDSEEEDNKALQKFSIFKFTDAGFSLNTHADESSSSDEENNKEASHCDDDSNSNDGDNASDDDDTSSTSTDSFNNDWDDIEEDDFTSRFRVPGLFKTSVGLGNRYISRTSNHSRLTRTSQGGTGSNYKSSNPGAESTDLHSSKRRKNKANKKNKNIVGIFDFSHLLPDKRELAAEYRVLGDSPENLAKYNGQVARRYGLTEISNAWDLLEMVLIKDIEINDINPVYYSAGVMKNTDSTIAKNVEAMNHLIKVNELTKKLFSNHTYRFYWGSHPYGYSWLIKEMMEYFEKRGNLQMVVMISCILYENTRNVASNLDDVFNIPIHTPYEIKPQPPSMIQMKRHNEGSVHELDRHYSFHKSFSTEASDFAVTDLGFYNHPKHRNSSISVFRKDITASSYARSVTSNPDDMDYDPSSLSQSQSHSFFRRSFTLSPKMETDQRLKKQSSDIRKTKGIQHFTTNAGSLINSNSNPGSFNHSHGSNTKKNITKGGTLRPPPVVSVNFENVDSLDLFDDIYTKPLLSSQDENKIRIYRQFYADMLYNWNFPANRIKILKFNYPNSNYKASKSQFIEHECSFGFRKQNRTSLHPDLPHVYPLSTIDSARESPWIMNKSNQLKYCNLCDLMVSKRLVICTSCEHVLHSHCALEWWSEEEDAECPSGCGCRCMNSKL